MKSKERNMQSYLWIDKKTGKTIRVERPMRESQRPPEQSELLINRFMSISEVEKAEWERLIEGGSFSKGFGKKGSW